MKTDVVIEELKKGEKLFSTIRGEIEFFGISNLKGDDYPIECKDEHGNWFYFTIEGIEGNEGKLPSLFKTSPFKETETTPEYVYLTVKCISEGKGVGVNPELIKIIK